MAGIKTMTAEEVTKQFTNAQGEVVITELINIITPRRTPIGTRITLIKKKTKLQ